jgi:GTP-binding protein
MTIKTKPASFLKSAKLEIEFPPADRPEIALMGRSNAGKSSFLNAWVGRRSLAKVSQQPGKTRLLNFFDVGEIYRIVDMPGYGFASRGAEERDSWGKMIEGYVNSRSSLVGALLIMDIRRDWSSDEAMILNWLERRGVPLIVILNKMDKISRSQQAQRLREFQGQLPKVRVHGTSTLQPSTVKAVEDVVYRGWIEGSTALEPS